MALDLYQSSGDEAGIFNVLAKAFYAIKTLNVMRSSVVPVRVKEYIDRFKLATVTLEGDKSLDSVATASTSWSASGTTITQALANSLSQFIRAAVAADDPAATGTLADALARIIAQMEDAGLYVDANAITLALSAGGSNLSDAGICYTAYDALERQIEHILAEAIAVTCKPGAAGTASLTFSGETAVADKTRETWPAGSGSKVTVATGAGNLIANGDFETASSSTPTLPANWTLSLGTAGENVSLTSLEVQTVAISGTPTGGSYWLTWSNGTRVHSSSELPYNATQSQVQTALRRISGLGAVTVATTGTSPNLTHSISFVDAPGNPAQLTSIDGMTGGTHAITHATTTAGPAGAYRGKALKITGVATGYAFEVHTIDTQGASTGSVTFTYASDGTGPYYIIDITSGPATVASQIVSGYLTLMGRAVTVTHSAGVFTVTFTTEAAVELVPTMWDSSTNGSGPTTIVQTTTGTPGTPANTRIFQPVSLTPGNVYFVAMRVRADAAIAGGNFIVELIDGATGSAVGSMNSKTVACTSIGASSHSFIFQRIAIPATQVEQVYLRLRVESLTRTKSIYVDEVQLLPATQLYPGGPYVAAVPGRALASAGDTWTLTATNDRAGELQEWFDRVFRMADLGLRLPTSGSDLIPDSIIA